MSLLDLLDRPIAYHHVYRRICGSTVAALMLSQLTYWQNIVDKGNGGVNGWFFKTSQEIEAETGLSRHEQITARKYLIKLNIIEIKKEGLPCRLFYRINRDLLVNLLEKYHQNKDLKRVKNNKKKLMETEEYVQAAVNHKNPANPVAYAACIKKRLRQQGGLSQADKDQLAKWQEDARPLPQLRPGNVIEYDNDRKITVKQVYDSGIETDDGYLPIGPLIKDIKSGAAKVLR